MYQWNPPPPSGLWAGITRRHWHWTPEWPCAIALCQLFGRGVERSGQTDRQTQTWRQRRRLFRGCRAPSILQPSAFPKPNLVLAHFSTKEWNPTMRFLGQNSSLCSETPGDFCLLLVSFYWFFIQFRYYLLVVPTVAAMVKVGTWHPSQNPCTSEEVILIESIRQPLFKRKMLHG